MSEPMTESQIYGNLLYLKNQMELSKSEARTPLDRNKAVAITQLELVIAYWKTFIVNPLSASDTSEQ